MNDLQKIDILMPVGEKGGVENVVAKTAVYLMKRGYRVRVVQLVWEHTRWVPAGVAFYPLLEGRGHYTLEQFVDKYTEFLQAHGTPDLILAATWPAMVLVAQMSMAVRLQVRGKIISWLHGPLERYEIAGFGGAEYLQPADAVFVLNQRTAELLQNRHHCQNVAIVRNPVDFMQCPLIEKQHLDSRRLLYVGRLSKEKRIDILIHALRYARGEWSLRIVGEGEERAALEKLVRNCSLEDQVEFLGWQDHPWEHTDGVAATVLSSEYECFPLAAVESLACGIPVIAPPVDGITELVEPGKNGFLYPQGDSRALAHVLDSIASGEVSAGLPALCRQSVEQYEESKALQDFEEKLSGVLDKISVIIPCHNVAGQIVKCLDSIFVQSRYGANVEVICVDDGSVDDTAEILAEYEKGYSDRMAVVLLAESVGPENARNIGMQYASGNRVAFVDVDAPGR